jgi:endonuclease/exonuclease/phosphatase (EEP) superfamily protein YafD
MLLRRRLLLRVLLLLLRLLLLAVLLLALALVLVLKVLLGLLREAQLAELPHAAAREPRTQQHEQQHTYVPLG